MIGQNLLHYEILALVGKGGMGEVYRARDTKLEREVAIKILPREMSGDPERIARFRREARTLATLQHTNVASVYGFEDTAEARFLVMEHVEGEDLQQRLERGAVPLDEAVDIARQIAAGLEAAHEQGIVHRDLKPANVKLTPDGQVKILDFGLARAYLGDEGDETDPAHSPTITAAMTQAGTILGTASYMSPEQARGKRIDRRADIWAYGVILFEMLSGQRLFPGETVSDTLAGVLKTEIDLDQLPRNCPGALRQLLERCLDRNPATRLRDVGEARVLLERPLADAAPVTGGAPASGRRLALTALGGLVLGAILMGTFTLGGSGAPPEAQIQFSIPRQTDTQARPALSPDGTRLLYTSEGALWVRQFSSAQPRLVAGSEGAIVGNWSPDGEWIVYSTRTTLFKSRPDGSDRTRLCTVPTDLHDFAGSVDWTRDGRIVFAPGDVGLMSVTANGGDPKVLLPPDEAETDFHHIFVLPDDRGFLFHPHADLTFDSIHLFDGTERHEVLRLEGTTLNSAAYTAGHLVFTRSFENPGVWAVPFSLDRLETTGDPFMVIPDGSFPTVSRNGDLAYVPESPISGQIVRMDPQGRVTGEIGETTVGMDDLQVSPDGREALVVIDGDNYELWVVDLETAERRRLTFSREEISGPSWSADGERIVYTAGNSSHTLFQQIIERDGTPVDAVDVRGYSPRLSHDGRYLVLSNWDEANDPDIGYVDLQDPDAGTVPIVDSPFAETAPRLSPDDRWVLYASTESGQSEIMLRSFPDGDQERQVSSEGGYAAMWDPSGERIYYRTPGSGWLMSVDVSRDPLRLSAPRRAFAIDTAREVTLASDGSFYGLRMSAGGSQGVYSVWLNWGQGLGD